MNSLELGGAERQALLLARDLSERSMDVQVWGLGQAGVITSSCDRLGIPWKTVPVSCHRWKQPYGLMRLVNALRTVKPDVLLPYTMVPNVLCGLTWKMTGAKVCIWNQRDAGVARMLRIWEKLAVRRARWFVANSQESSDFLTRELKVPAGRIRVIRNGVELPGPKLDRDGWRQQLGVPKDCFLACMLANLTALKDHETLVRAWREVVDRLGNRQSAVLLCTGRLGETYPRIKSLVEELKLTPNVIFPGQVDDVAGLLASVDMGVFSSRSEGCPNGVLECMAAGLAIVGTDIPGIREAVGVNGFPYLAAAGNVPALAKTICHLIADATMRANLGVLNRQRIESEFQPKRMCDEMVSVIEGGLRSVSATQ